MSYILYVSQGRSARLDISDLPNEVNGLFTDSISSCNIIISFNENRILLIHADLITPRDKIKQELDWLAPSDPIYIYAKATGNRLKDELYTFLRKAYPHKEIDIKGLTKNQTGLFISSNVINNQPDNNNSGLTSSIPKVMLFEDFSKPSQIIYHPLHNQFQTIQKINLTIGGKRRIGNTDILSVDRIPIKTICIFDGLAWIRPEPSELSINNNTLLEKNLRGLKKGDTLQALMQHIYNISQANGFTTDENYNNLFLTVAQEVDYYLSQYDHAFVFKKMLIEILEQDQTTKLLSSASAEDINLLNYLMKNLKADMSVSKINELIESYKQTAPDTPFKKDILPLYAPIYERYEGRNTYAESTKLCTDTKRQAVLFSIKASKAYQDRNFNDAALALQQAITLLRRSTYKTDQMLAKAYHELGKSLLEQNKPSEAKLNLTISYQLYSLHTPPATDMLANISIDLKQCEIQLPKSINTSSSTASTLNLLQQQKLPENAADQVSDSNLIDINVNSETYAPLFVPASTTASSALPNTVVPPDKDPITTKISAIQSPQNQL